MSDVGERDYTELEADQVVAWVRGLSAILEAWEEEWLDAMEAGDDVTKLPRACDAVVDDILGLVPRQAWLVMGSDEYPPA